MNATKGQATGAAERLRGWIGASQRAAIAYGFRGEEKQFYFDKLIDLDQIVGNMPQTYQTQDQQDPIVWLHYFASGTANWYITEKDAGAPGDTPEMFQSQAFGLADLFGDGGEFGYLSIPKILSVGGELDLYWIPKPLSKVREKTRRAMEYR